MAEENGNFQTIAVTSSSDNLPPETNEQINTHTQSHTRTPIIHPEQMDAKEQTKNTANITNILVIA